MDKKSTSPLILLGLASLGLWLTLPPTLLTRGPLLLDFLPRYFALFAIYLGAVIIIYRSPNSQTFLVIFIFAILFRLPLLTQPPTLSDDVYRYIWEGHLQNVGVNPYQDRVDSPQLDSFTIPARGLVNNPYMASPYLPLAQIFFAVGNRLWPQSPTLFQIAALTFDLLTGLFLAWLLKSLNRPPALTLIYLWNPLIIVEFTHGAHVDGLMVCLLIGSLQRSAVNGQRSSAILLALATLVKPIPLLLLPVLAPRWGWRNLGVYGLTVGLGILPYLRAGLGLTTDVWAGTGLWGATRIYLTAWNFNGGLYHWLEVWVTGYATEGAVPFQTPGVSLAKAIATTILVGVLIWVLWRSTQTARASDSLKICLIPCAAYLILTPTLHPWYLAPLIALVPLALEDSWPFLYWSASVMLSYLTYLNPNDFRETNFVRGWEYFPLYVLWLGWALWRWRGIGPFAKG